MIRGYLFTGVYYVLSLVYVLASLPFLAFPGRGPVSFIIKSYTCAIRFALHYVGGIRTEVRGRENLPEGAFILAGKHQSWGDGFLVYPEISNLAFVTGDHLEKFPLVGGILKKLGAIVIDTCGGGDRKAKSLAEGMEQAKAEGRRVLIYPEGHLAPPGYHFRYKPGVWHMQKAMDVPVVAIATNLGCFWQQTSIAKRSGTAVIEFLPPIAPGLSKEDFMETLMRTTEQRSNELIRQAGQTTVPKSALLPDPAKGTLAIAPPQTHTTKSAS